MKLRVKDSKATFRIVVDDDCTYENFKAAVALTLGCPPDHLKGSLNNKVTPVLKTSRSSAYASKQSR